MPESKNKSGQTGKQGRASAPIDPTYGHLQPQAVDVERVVLGALMIDKDAFSVISESIRPRPSTSLVTRRSTRPSNAQHGAEPGGHHDRDQ
jgi:hypothetical protein